MYRSSGFRTLLVLLCLAAICSGTPIYSSARHDPGEHGDDGPPVTGKPAEMPIEDNQGSQGSEMPESDMGSGDHSGKGDSGKVTESDMKPDSQMEQDDSDEMTESDISSGDQMEQGGSPEATESDMGSEEHRDHGHGSDSSGRPEGEKPLGEEGNNSHMSGDGEITETGTEVDTEDSEPSFMTASDEPDASPAAEGGVCIATNMLGNFEADELVFENHIFSRVLCDVAGSCATKGHIVTFKGKPMMMTSYCNIVGCKESIMEVNSPKYRRGLKIQSKSENMHFTAFAAKYETHGEEAVLSAAVHVGL